MKKEYEIQLNFNAYYRKNVEADSIDEAADKALQDREGWELCEARWEDTDDSEIWVMSCDGTENDYAYRN